MVPPPVPPPPQSEKDRRLTQRDALTYLREVKEKFKNERYVYEAFLDIMKKFKSQEYVFVLHASWVHTHGTGDCCEPFGLLQSWDGYGRDDPR